MSEQMWRKCSSCKKDIAVKQKYYVCSVSTCTAKRTNYVFCSVPCFENHLPGARHKDAAAIEMFAPATPEPKASTTATAEVERPKRRVIVSGSGQQKNEGPRVGASSDEILIVASKLKQFIKDHADMNTSGGVMAVLSDIVRYACVDAIEKARAEGRKTVLERDFKKKVNLEFYSVSFHGKA